MLQITVPTEIPLLSISTDLLAENSIAETSTFQDSTSVFTVPVVDDNIDSVNDIQIINDSAGFRIDIRDSTETGFGRVTILFNLSFAHSVAIRQSTSGFSDDNAELTTYLIVEFSAAEAFATSLTSPIEVMRVPISMFRRNESTVDQDQSQPLVNLSGSFTLGSRPEVGFLRARVIALSDLPSISSSDNFSLNEVSNVNASMTVIKK